MNIELKLIKASDLYRYNSRYDIYEDMSSDDTYMMDIYGKAEDLKIVGIVCAKSGSSTMALSTGVSYTGALTLHVIEEAGNTAI